MTDQLKTEQTKTEQLKTIQLQKEKVVFGVDLGTTYSCGFVKFGDNRPEIILNQKGETTTASYVAWNDEDKKWLVGEEAKKYAIKHPEWVCFDAKRMIGKKFEDKDIEEMKQNWPFRIGKAMNGHTEIILGPKDNEMRFAPEFISSRVLAYMKNCAEVHLKKKYNYDKMVKNVVITCPADFGTAERDATKSAGQLADLKVLGLLNEPTAVAKAFTEVKNNMRRSNYMIMDFGGGTFDVTVMECRRMNLKAKSSKGDNRLGGQDLNYAMMNYCLEQEEWKANEAVIRQNAKCMRKLFDGCEKAKRNLTDEQETFVEVDGFWEDKDLSVKITRDKFEELCKEFFDKVINCCEEARNETGLAKENITDVILAGGSSRIPAFVKMAEKYLGKAPDMTMHPDEAIANGACFEALSLSYLRDKKKAGNVLTGINVVPLATRDILSRSIGVEITSQDGSKSFHPIIEEGTLLPSKKSKVFYGIERESNEAEIRFFEAKNGVLNIDDCAFLGDFIITNLVTEEDGAPELEVTVNVTRSGCMMLKAKDKIGNVVNSVPIGDDDKRVSAKQMFEKYKAFTAVHMPMTKDEIEEAKMEEERIAEEIAKREEARKKADFERVSQEEDAEQKRLEEEAEKIRLEEEAQRLEEEARKAEEERIRLEEEAKQQAESVERKKLEEDAQKVKEEEKRLLKEAEEQRNALAMEEERLAIVRKEEELQRIAQEEEDMKNEEEDYQIKNDKKNQTSSVIISEESYAKPFKDEIQPEIDTSDSEFDGFEDDHCDLPAEEESNDEEEGED